MKCVLCQQRTPTYVAASTHPTPPLWLCGECHALASAGDHDGLVDDIGPVLAARCAESWQAARAVEAEDWASL